MGYISILPLELKLMEASNKRCDTLSRRYRKPISDPHLYPSCILNTNKLLNRERERERETRERDERREKILTFASLALCATPSVLVFGVETSEWWIQTEPVIAFTTIDASE